MEDKYLAEELTDQDQAILFLSQVITNYPDSSVYKLGNAFNIALTSIQAMSDEKKQHIITETMQTIRELREAFRKLIHDEN